MKNKEKVKKDKSQEIKEPKKTIKKVKADDKEKKSNQDQKKPDIVLIILYIMLFALIAFLIYSKIKNRNVLRNDDKLSIELGSYFSVENLGACNGLFNYDDHIITYDDIDSNSRVCVAYHKSDLESAKALTYEAKEKDSTCDVDGMIFKTDDDSNKCTVTKIDRKIIDNTYKKIFGKEIEGNDTFKFDGYHVCYLKDDYYYCGLSEYYRIVLGREINVYRSVDRVTKIDGVITIYDYFAKVLDGKECFKDYNNLNPNPLCNENLVDGPLKYKFLKKYGVRYKHIYKEAKDGTYYWVSTEPIYDPNNPEKYQTEEE